MIGRNYVFGASHFVSVSDTSQDFIHTNKKLPFISTSNRYKLAIFFLVNNALNPAKFLCLATGRAEKRQQAFIAAPDLQPVMQDLEAACG